MTKVIIDAGHGGTAFGHYLTAGKRSPEVPPGIFEGGFNRMVSRNIDFNLKLHSCLLNNGPINIPLRERVKYINQLFKKEPDLISISIHANAARGKGWSRARGSVVFVSKRATEKELFLAKQISDEMRKLSKLIGLPHRGIKKANFKMVYGPKCPAVLIECGFMTNKADCEILKDNRWDIVESITIGIEKYDEKYGEQK